MNESEQLIKDIRRALDDRDSLRAALRTEISATARLTRDLVRAANDRDAAIDLCNAAMTAGLAECERLRAQVSTLRDERKTQGDAIEKLCDDINRMNEAQRPGQAFYNALYAIDPVFAECVRNTDADPFNVRGDGVEIIARALSAWREHLTTGAVTSTRDDRMERLESQVRDLSVAVDAMRGIKPLPAQETTQDGWPIGGLNGPATVCERCKGDEVSGCICGMVPGTELRR